MNQSDSPRLHAHLKKGGGVMEPAVRFAFLLSRGAAVSPSGCHSEDHEDEKGPEAPAAPG